MASPASTDNNASTTGVTLAEFHYFPKLPIELRLKIWAFTIEPRTVEVRFSKDRRRNEHKFISKTPVLLHVHSESRVEGLRYYELSKQHTKKTRKFGQNAINCFYFNAAIDMLHINSNGHWHPMRVFIRQNEFGLLDRVQKLAIQGASIRIDLVREYLQRLSSKGFELTIVELLDCERFCSCTTRDMIECDVLKKINEAQGRDSRGIQSIQDTFNHAGWGFMKKWSFYRLGPSPKVRSVVACNKSKKGVGKGEIIDFRAAMAARDSGGLT